VLFKVSGAKIRVLLKKEEGVPLKESREPPIITLSSFESEVRVPMKRQTE
jgi:hypothetical protein